MDFPKESVAQAQEIAKKYCLRAKSNYNKAVHLYNGAFLEIKYGFSDSIKLGKCGQYLHEVKTNVECFSLAGINYLIARELDLKPTLYNVYGMRDIKEGADDSLDSVGDHSFITIRANNKEYVVDPFYSKFGEIRKNHNKLIILTKGNFGKEVIERTYNSLVKLSEKDYLKMMEKNRTPESGKLNLCSGQRIMNCGISVRIQYIPKTRELITSKAFEPPKNLIGENIDNFKVFELQAKIDKKGAWCLEQGQINFFYVRNTGWKREDHEDVHSKMSLSFDLVKNFIEHLNIAARFFGTKTNLEDRCLKNPLDYFEKIGFDQIGKITKKNGVDVKKHNKLLDLINSSFPKKEPKHIQEYVDINAKYSSLAYNNRSENNPRGHLYSKKEHDAFIAHYLDLTRTEVLARYELFFNNLLARSGLKRNFKQASKKLRCSMNETSVDKLFTDLLNVRKAHLAYFNKEIDFSLFKQEIEDNKTKIKATPEERRLYYQTLAFRRLSDLCFMFSTLQIKTFQKGLQKILK